jgi:hypothetical protein
MILRQLPTKFYVCTHSLTLFFIIAIDWEQTDGSWERVNLINLRCEFSHVLILSTSIAEQKRVSFYAFFIQTDSVDGRFVANET